MPYELRSEGGRYCVYKVGEPEALKCYDAEPDAADFLAALNLNADKSAGPLRFTQAEAQYVPLSATAGAACANCRFFDSGMSACLVVETYPLDILPTGHCKQHTVLPEQMPETEPPDDMEEQDTEEVATIGDMQIAVDALTALDTLPMQKTVQPASANVGLLGQIKALLSDTLNRRTEPAHSGIKTYGNRWVAWFSNNAKDRDGEYFPEQAIDAYVQRVDTGVVPAPELWTWHMPGTRHGQADWLGRIGHFLVAAGTFDDTPAGKAAQAHYARAGRKYALSHGFTYDTASYADKAFWDFNTFEISTLPPKVAANPYTLFEAKEQGMLTPEKEAHLKRLFGEEVAAEIIADTDAKSKALDELGVTFKEFVDPARLATKDAAPDADGQAALADLVLDITRDHAEVVKMASAIGKAVRQHRDTNDEVIKGVRDQIEALRKELASLREQLDSRPRVASTDAVTQIDKSQLSKSAQAAADQNAKRDPFWSL